MRKITTVLLTEKDEKDKERPQPRAVLKNCDVLSQEMD